MLAGDGLKPSKFGKRIHFNGTKRSVADGPFAETKELEVLKGRAAQVVSTIGDIKHQLIRVKDKEKLSRVA